LDRVRACGAAAEWLNVGNSAALLSEQAAAIGAIAAQFGMKALLRPAWLSMDGRRSSIRIQWE